MDSDATRSFLLEDYRLKAEYLIDQFSRMWNRFQFFLTVETLTAGLYFAPLADKRLGSAPAFAMIGIAVSLLWYMVGAEDRAYVVHYRSQLEHAAKVVSSSLGLHEHTYVGDVRGWGSYFASPLEWRIERLSITHLAALFPLLMLAFWIVMLWWAPKH